MSALDCNQDGGPCLYASSPVLDEQIHLWVRHLLTNEYSLFPFLGEIILIFVAFMERTSVQFCYVIVDGFVNVCVWSA